jgi:hypothetical protein
MTQTSLGLSDAEFLEKDPAELLAEEATVETTIETEETEVPSVEEGSDAQEQTDVETNQDEVSQPEGDTQPEHEKSTDSDATESLDTSTEDSTDTKGDTPETKEFDYESAYKKVSEPFRANGIDIKVDDPEDIVRLMQMGANYQKKMSQLKPHLKIIKMLENNDLLKPEQLNNLIDVFKKDPKAIAKLVKESSLDPLDIDKDAPSDYEPNDYSVSDGEIELDQVLEDIKDTDTFNRTINVLTKSWDAASKQTISEHPEIIKVINSHMANGVFDKVDAVLQRDKALGKTEGLPDVEAYKQIADYMFKNGELHTNSPEDKSKVSSKMVEAQDQANADRNKQRKAVAPVKQTTTKKSVSDENFLGLSDDEFMKKYAVR